MQYNNAQYKGKEVTPINSAIIHENKTVGTPLIGINTDIKGEAVFTEQDGDATWQPYVEYKSEGSLIASDATFTDKVLRPVKLEFIKTFTMDELRFTRFGDNMKSGAWNTLSTEFEQAVVDHNLAKLGADAEGIIWNAASAATKAAVAAGSAAASLKTYVANAPAKNLDGLFTQLVASGSAIHVQGTTLDLTNLDEEFEKLYLAIPSTLRGHSDLTIFAPRGVDSMIRVVNSRRDYRDLFTVNGDSIEYLGVKIEFVPLAPNKMIAGLKKDLIAGSDMTSDANYMEIGRVNNFSDKYFFRSVMTLGTLVLVVPQFVIYG